MNIDQVNKSKVPHIVIDNKLEKFRGRVLFPEKLAKANEILAQSGLPEIPGKYSQPSTDLSKKAK